MKKYLILCLIAILSVSCEKMGNGGGNASFTFLPRQASHISIVPGEKEFYTYNGIEGRKFHVFEGNSIPGENLFFSIQMSNHDPRVTVSQLYPDLDSTTLDLYLDLYVDLYLGIYPISYLEYIDSVDTPIPTIEQQIRLDFDMWKKKENSKLTDAIFMTVEYRTTQIRNLTISTLDKPLFGKAAGESLNEFFDIYGYEPPVIVSAPTNTLVYGYSDIYSGYPTTIAEWLDLSPLAQANMWLFPNKKMDGLPMDVRFVVQMETAEGVVFSDTTRVLTLTN